MSGIWLPRGIGAHDLAAIKALVTQILPSEGQDLSGEQDEAPYTAPLLIMAQMDEAPRRALLQAGAGQVVIQEHLTLSVQRPLIPGEPIQAAVETEISSTLRGLHVVLSSPAGEPLSTIVATLRLVDAAMLDHAVALPLARSTRGALVKMSQPFTINPTQIMRYLALAGDDNPVHTDPSFAASLGFARPVVPGALLAALAQGVVACQGGDRMARLNMRFTAPILVEETLKIAIETKGQALRLHYVAQGERVVAIADVAMA